MSKINPRNEPEKTINYIDISGIDNVRNVILEAKSFQLKEAPSRARQIIHAGDILFATVRPYLRNIAAVPSNYDGQIASTGFSVLRPASGVDARFLFYCCTSLEFVNAVSGKQYGVSYPAVKDEQVREQIILLPPSKEQRRIVAKIEELFSELDDGVENLKAAREQLKVYRQAVLKHAFEGKLTAQWREDNKDKLETADQLFARIKSEGAGRIRRCEDGDLPALPDGWIWLRYGELCSLVRNGISQKPDGEMGTKIFRISAVRPMSFDLTDVRYIDNESAVFDQYYLQSGDIVFTRYNGSRAYVGVAAEYRSDGTHLYPDKLIRTRLAGSSVLPGYIEKAVNCGASRKFIERRIRTTAGQSGVSGTDIKAMPVPICSTAEQAAISARLNEYLTRIDQVLAEIDQSLVRSNALRQSILKKAFSGHLVAQDANDEPASVLLERIRAEKAEGKVSNKNNKRKDAA